MQHMTLDTAQPSLATNFAGKADKRELSNHRQTLIFES